MSTAHAPPAWVERSHLTKQLLAAAGEATRTERERLLEEVVRVNLPVARAIALRYQDRGVDVEDLVQVASEGLVLAVNRFDSSQAEDLLTYAVPTIRGTVIRYFRDHGWAVRPPRRVQQLQGQLIRVEDDLRLVLGREPTTDEVARQLGVARSELDRATVAFGSFRLSSLDQAVTQDGEAALGDLVATERDDIAPAEARTVLTPLLRGLSARDRRILYLRFYEDRTQAEIGDELGVTQMQVSRLLARILRSLRSQIDAA